MNSTSHQNKFNQQPDLQRSTLLVLIVILFVVFLLQSFVYVFYLFTFSKENAFIHFLNDIQSNVVLPLQANEFLKKPWTLVTHMFYHAESWELFGNIIWLGVFGYFFQRVTNHKKIIPLFIYGALGGAAAIILINLIPAISITQTNISGASAGIMAIAIATTVLASNEKIFAMIKGGISFWIITDVYVLIEITVHWSSGLFIADVAGGITGFFFAFFLKRGFDWSIGMNSFFAWINNLFHPATDMKKANEDS
ncbi:MAG: rhomboid family intramembrane serine protease [Chitinophagaceae bacterium]|nr:MAG: rhomboid family intramembrane serine protease [Chitinophagaceae bacterium]